MANVVDKVDTVGDILVGARGAVNAAQNGVSFQNGAQMAGGVSTTAGAATWFRKSKADELAPLLEDMELQKSLAAKL